LGGSIRSTGRTTSRCAGRPVPGSPARYSHREQLPGSVHRHSLNTYDSKVNLASRANRVLRGQLHRDQCAGFPGSPFFSSLHGVLMHDRAHTTIKPIWDGKTSHGPCGKNASASPSPPARSGSELRGPPRPGLIAGRFARFLPNILGRHPTSGVGGHSQGRPSLPVQPLGTFHAGHGRHLALWAWG